MAADTSRATRSASMAVIIWQRRAPLQGSRNCHRPIGSVRAKPFRPRCRRKSRRGRSELGLRRPACRHEGRDADGAGYADKKLRLHHRRWPRPYRPKSARARKSNRRGVLSRIWLVHRGVERACLRAVLLSARGRLFSVGGDLMSLVKQGDAVPKTIKAWTADLHPAIARMARMRAPV